MKRFALLVLLPGCVYFASDHHDGDVIDDCLRAVRSQPLQLRDPQTLQCGNYGSYCDPECGPCPARLEPVPTWGYCDSSCESLDEQQCEASAECRVVKNAQCEIDGNCLTSFLGCFPIDQQPDTSVSCFEADAYECSRSNACTALHSYVVCPTDATCDRPFELCVPEGASPGRCHGPVACRALPPECPAGTTPGVANQCWTGACIPDDLCEATP